MGKPAAKATNKHEFKMMVFAGIQTGGCTALAVYTHNNSSRIWPYVFSAVAIGGSYNFFRSVRKTFWAKTPVEKDRKWSGHDMATGGIIYLASLYGFSEGLKCNDKIWIPCLAIAASGYYCAVCSMNSLENVFNRKPFLKHCRALFEPTLIGCGFTYLLYFRKHQEEWIYWLPLVPILARRYWRFM